MPYLYDSQVTAVINQDERRLEIHPEMIYVGANLAPLLHIAMGKSEQGLPAKKLTKTNPEFKIISKQPHAEFTLINKAANYSAAAVALTVDDASFMNPGDILQVIGGEQLRITIRNNATNITVVRAQGTTAALTLLDNVPLYRIGRAAEEFSPRPISIGFLAVTATNYLQIIPRTYGVSNTLLNSDMVYGKKLPDLRKEQLLEWKKDVERTFIFGEPHYNATGGPNGKPIRKTGGLYYWINSVGNVQTGTTFTKAVWESYVQNLFTYQDQEWKVVLGSPMMITAINSWQWANLRFRPSDKLGGVWAAQIDTGHGTVFLIRDAILKNPAVGAGYGGVLLGFEPDMIQYAYLQNRDWHIEKDQQTAGDDGYIEKIIAEIGLHVERPENGRIAKGYTTWA